MTDAQLLANRFDMRNMIGCSARATTDSKLFLPVVEIGFICIYYERLGPALTSPTYLYTVANLAAHRVWEHG